MIRAIFVVKSMPIEPARSHCSVFIIRSNSFICCSGLLPFQSQATATDKIQQIINSPFLVFLS